MKRELFIRLPEDQGTIYDVIQYPAGELQVRFRPTALPQLREADAVTVVARLNDGNPMPLVLLTSALDDVISQRTDKLLELPYLPYSRADRRFVEGDCFGLRAFGEIIDGLRYQEVRTLDVHSLVARKYIANLQAIVPTRQIKKVIKRINLMRLGILLPDKGSLTRYPADAFGTKRVFTADKVRDAQTGKLSGFTVPTAAELSDIDALLIIDDICDGGGTFIGIGKELNKVAPQVDLYLYVSHGIFSAGLNRLLTVFKKIFTTDSFKRDETRFWSTHILEIV